MDLTELSKMIIGLLAVVNPIGAIPIFLSLTAGESRSSRQHTAKVAVFSVFVILAFSLLFGEAILHAFGISVNSFRVAGGILILLMAISMMHAKTSRVNATEDEKHTEPEESVAVVPLAIPLLAGPGAISTVILYAHRGESMMHYGMVGAAIATVSVVLLITLMSTTALSRFLSQTGINISTRIMGLILAALAIEFIANGMKGLFPSLVG